MSTDIYGKTPQDHANAVKGLLRKEGLLPQSQGRDPNDHATMELPLEEPDNGGSFVVGGIQCGAMRDDFVPPLPDDIVVRIAAGLYDDVDDEMPWVLLFLKAEADSENVLKRGKV